MPLLLERGAPQLAGVDGPAAMGDQRDGPDGADVPADDAAGAGVEHDGAVPLAFWLAPGAGGLPVEEVTRLPPAGEFAHEDVIALLTLVAEATTSTVVGACW